MVESALAANQLQRRTRGTCSTPGAAELPRIIAKNTKRLRTRRGYSLEKLAELSGVSRSMLHQIENGKSVPTVVVLWKIAQALDVQLDTLISNTTVDEIVAREARLPGPQAREVRFNCRSFLSPEADRKVEVLELRLTNKQLMLIEPRRPGALANVVITSGKVAIALGDGRAARLQRGDALTFEADVAHSYRNVGAGLASLYLLMLLPQALDH